MEGRKMGRKKKEKEEGRKKGENEGGKKERWEKGKSAVRYIAGWSEEKIIPVVELNISEKYKGEVWLVKASRFAQISSSLGSGGCYKSKCMSLN